MTPDFITGAAVVATAACLLAYGMVLSLDSALRRRLRRAAGRLIDPDGDRERDAAAFVRGFQMGLEDGRATAENAYATKLAQAYAQGFNAATQSLHVKGE